MPFNFRAWLKVQIGCAVLFTLLILALIARLRAETDCTEFWLRWNLFARHANSLLHQVDARPEVHQRKKDELNREWQWIYRCECF